VYVCGLPGEISHTSGGQCLDYINKNKCTLYIVGHGDAVEISFKKIKAVVHLLKLQGICSFCNFNINPLIAL
jgi:hypothetical protein